MDGFGDWQSPSYGLESTWKKKKETVDGTMQTDPIFTEEKSIQSYGYVTVETQTDEEPQEELKLNPYPPSLYAFLAKVIDPMCEALQENQSPFNVRFSDDLYGNSSAAGSSTDNEAIKLHELKSSTVHSNCEGSCVTWSPTGNQVAVGYRSKNHENWCTHTNPISIWNLTRLGPELGQNMPHKEIFFNTCSTTLEFHPNNGNLLAVGLYSGEIALIDLNASSTTQKNYDDVTANNNKPPPLGHKLTNQEPSKVVDGSCHSMPIVGIQWVLLSQAQTTQLVQKNPSPSHSFILSAAKDGFIGIWSINTTYTRIFLERKFIAYSENLPDNISISKRTLSRVKEIGITAMSTCKDDPATFVFATYGSMIFQGDLLTNVEIDDVELKTRSSPKETAPIMNAVTSFITDQAGYINALDCSPYHRNLILSITHGGHVLLQNLLQITPTLQFYMDEDTATDVKWSGRPMMFGVAEGPKLSLFDLTVSKTKPVLVATHNAQLRTIAFEKTDTGLVATMDENGVLYIWKMPKSLTTHQFTELDALIDLGQINNKVSEVEVEPTSKVI